MAIPDVVSDILGPVVPQLGVELVDVEWSGGTLRVVVDSDGGVTTDQLASVNRMVSPLLDQHDPISGRYTLEVSSPGVERPLKRLDHYRRAVGEDVIVKVLPGHEPRRLRGRLRLVEDDAVTLDVTEIDGVDLDQAEERVVPFSQIDKARTSFDWSTAFKSNGRSGAAGKKTAKQKKKNRPTRSTKAKIEEASGAAASPLPAELHEEHPDEQ